jgi:hypothetical protein
MVRTFSPSARRGGVAGDQGFLEAVEELVIPHYLQNVFIQGILGEDPENFPRFGIQIRDQEIIVHHDDTVVHTPDNGFAFLLFGNDPADVQVMELF